MQPFSQGSASEGHISEEECEPGPVEGGFGAAAAPASAAHETRPSVSVQLRDARAARHGRHGAHTARLVDAGRARRARPQPGVHRPVVVHLRVPERRRPVHDVPARRRASGTRTRIPHQHRGIRAHLHHVPFREPRRAREKLDRLVPRRSAAGVDMHH
jgi:hypothetical protein